MRRLTFEVLLAGTLAFTPAALAQTTNPATDTSPPTTRSTGTPSTPAPIDDTGTTRRPVPPVDPTAPGGPMNPSPTIPSPSPTTAPPNTLPPDTTRRSPSPTESAPGAPTGTTSEKTNDAGRTATASADPDVGVMQKVHQANQQELEMAQMALDKAQSPRVKAYAKKLVSDHTAADKQLLAYADKKKIDRSELQVASTPTEAAKAGDPHAKLNTSSGAEFDRDFVTVMIDEHDKAIEMVKTAKGTVSDKQLAKMLSAMLPKLERHKKMAQDLLDKHLKS
jgi:putative membrane protein